jgi:hypothetical protein
MERYLYRGVNPKIHHDTGGRLIPKAVGEPFERCFKYGQFRYGEGTYGKSVKNAAVGHQTNSKAYPTSGVSTTPSFDSAKAYATHKGLYATGFVYKIDTQLLESAKITAYEVQRYAAKPAKPEDKEIILVADDFGALPADIIVQIIQV